MNNAGSRRDNCGHILLRYSLTLDIWSMKRLFLSHIVGLNELVKIAFIPLKRPWAFL